MQGFFNAFLSFPKYFGIFLLWRVNTMGAGSSMRKEAGHMKERKQNTDQNQNNGQEQNNQNKNNR